MANAASLMVRIGADVQDFSRGISRAEKDATRGFDTIRKAGEKLSLSITLPFIVAAGALSKMAADAEDASARVDRVFGDMASTVKRQLKDLAGVIPETDDAMMSMVVKSDNMLQGLGYGAEKAAKLSVSMLKLAGDMAAFARVPVSEALDALDKGLAGKTRGLIQFGIVVSADQIKLEAMRRGLLDNHRTLTELGTAEISEMLIRKAATRITGEAERVAGQAGTTFKLLKRDVEDLGDKIGSVLLPSMAALARHARDVVDTVSKVPPDLLKFAFAGAAAAAAIGPILIGVANLAKTLLALRVAYAAVSGVASLGTIFGAIASAPFATIVIGIGAITTALYGYYRAWRLFSGKDAADEADADAAANDATKTFLRNTRHARMKKPAAEGKKSQESRDALGIFKEHAALVEDQYQNAVDVGGSLIERMAAINALHSEAAGLLAKQNGEWNEMAKAAADVVQKTQGIIDVRAVSAAMSMGLSKGPRGLTPLPQLLGDASRNAMSPVAINLGLANKAIGDETSLRTREAALRLQDTFDATREATLQFGEQIRSTKNDLALRAAALTLPDTFNATGEAAVQMGEQIRRTKNDLDLRAALLKLKDGFDAVKTASVLLDEKFRAVGHGFDVAYQQFKSQWGSKSAIGASAMSGIKEGATQLLAMFTPAGLAMLAFGKILEGLQPVIDAVLQPLVELGKIVAIMLMPYMKLLFNALKLFGIVVSFVGEVLARVSGGISTAIGGLIKGIGHFIRQIPFLGGVGQSIENFGQGILDFAKDQYTAADQLARARKELEHSEYGLAGAANAAASALLNVPQGFRVALAQWRAQLPFSPAAPVGGGSSGGGGGSGSGGGSSGGGGGGGGAGGFVPAAADNRAIVLVLDGRVVARSTLKAFRAAAQGAYADSTRWPDLMTV